MARQVGDPTRLGETVGALGYALLMKRDLDAALPLLEEELGIARRAGNRFQTADALASITAVHMLRRDHEQARRVAEEAISVFKDLENAAGVSMMLETLAAMEGEQGGHERAARLSGAAAKIRDTIGGGAPPTAYMFEDPIPAARAAIGDGAVDRLIQEGREMGLDKAVAYALDAE
jgi:tetratricopeptide (TPR) repeat protein